ncbi:MAG: pilus assembly protein [Chloroflexota bacterium]|nr:pilus assembly protein [Chloroflexota bacterium]
MDTPGQAKGQALVEFAFALPLFMLFVFTTIQLSLVFVAYYSETRMARETARWLAIHSSSTDLEVAQHVQNTMLPGLVNGPPGISSGDTVNAQYPVGEMTVTYSACGAIAPPCTGLSRAPGATLYVDMSYDVRSLLFLPSTFRLGNVSTSIPTSLPAYRVHVMVE